jgi:deazaflavin-dependent oxidoreductase (nitroreductase family)
MVQGTSAENATRPPEPIKYPRNIAFMVKVDKYFLRLFNCSMVGSAVTRLNGLPRVSSLILITKGRRTGRRIETPIYYFRDGKNFVVIGSKGGNPDHPAWILNLEAYPDCQIHVDWRTHNMRSRVAVGDERARLWIKACDVFAPYADYQIFAGKREIPVVVLDER